MFPDRREAGRTLATKLAHLRGEDVVVVGLPRGGVPVAAEVARALDAPLDVIVVRKLGVPYQPELAMGAIGEGGVRVINEQVRRLAGISDDELNVVEAHERAELALRAQRFRGGRPRISFAGRVVVVVDDGVATGATARAACDVARAGGASRVVLAVPVAPVEWTDRLAGTADEFVCVATPEPFHAVGQFYIDFTQTTDDEVVLCLNEAGAPRAAVSAAADDPPVRDDDVTLAAGNVSLEGHLTVPEAARGITLFVHGSGSSRHSPRNRYVAEVLNAAGLATLLFDLLTVDEELIRANVFDIELLARRLRDVTRWVRAQPDTAGLPIAYFGASTGAAAALWAAAGDRSIAAVVSRGGRPDLAEPRLGEVTAPTLLIVGGNDDVVLALNHRAQTQLRCDNELAVVPGATHLFEEPGTLRTAADLARDWLVDRFAASSASPPPKVRSFSGGASPKSARS
jgi:putative phosphoribosyl transferase